MYAIDTVCVVTRRIRPGEGLGDPIPVTHNPAGRTIAMVVADLHVHTTNSDGNMRLTEVPAAATRAGVETVAITDHDRIHPDLDAPVQVRDGVELIHGIELRVQAGAQRVDLLGYGVEPTEELISLVRGLQENRIERAREIVDCIEDRLDVDLDVDFEPGVGRPHIARAIAESDAPQDFGAAFEDLIGDDEPCYVSRDIPSFDEGRSILADACAVVGLAHPYRYDDTRSALDLVSHLDAVERYYPYGTDPDQEAVAGVLDRSNVLATGGSDAHDDHLGRAGLDRQAYHRFRNEW